MLECDGVGFVSGESDVGDVSSFLASKVDVAFVMSSALASEFLAVSRRSSTSASDTCSLENLRSKFCSNFSADESVDFFGTTTVFLLFLDLTRFLAKTPAFERPRERSFAETFTPDDVPTDASKAYFFCSFFLELFFINILIKKNLSQSTSKFFHS